MAKNNRTFHDELILNQWLLSIFQQKDIQGFKQRFNNDRYETLDDNGHTGFFNELSASRDFKPDERILSQQDLANYDLNVVKHWQQITARRNEAEGHILKLKYFQYFSLLFTEIYLDFYFNRKAQMLHLLNEAWASFSQDKNAPNFQKFDELDLNKLAFWNATGSGKTLLMHVNILQYLHYSQSKDLSIFLITPREELSIQHLRDFELSGFHSQIFDKNKNINQTMLGYDEINISILEISKLKEKEGKDTVAVEQFSNLNKLVLVDEGHRGSSGNEWFDLRTQFIGDTGFAFEYSATFGQAVKNRKTAEDFENELRKAKAKSANPELKGKALEAEARNVNYALTYNEKKQARQQAIFEIYAKSVIFDYSYKYFYEDGYGKDFRILNMKAEAYAIEENNRQYFLACLLSFYQQCYLFEQEKGKVAEYNIEKPLWIFVGNTVDKEDSDIAQVLEQLAYFLNPQNRPQIETWLGELLADKSALLDSQNKGIFDRTFSYLDVEFGQNMAGLYADMLRLVFNAQSSQQLYVQPLKKAKGEVSLAVGNNPHFAVINVGNTANLVKQLEAMPQIFVANDEFSESLFDQINLENSQINLLIGSRKFTEGWSSWRVSTMGLLNMGTSEGSQIIQLFGRGVRLKGKDFSLRRSDEKNSKLSKLETLQIFGIKADYMAKFREYLEAEKIAPEAMMTVDIPVKKIFEGKNKPKLKTLRLKQDYQENRELGFKRNMPIELWQIPEKFQGKIKGIRAKLDLYSRLQLLDKNSLNQEKNQEKADLREINKLSRQVFAYFDWDKIYLHLQQLKLQNKWSNLSLNSEKIRQFVEQNDWYELYCPSSTLEVKRFADIAYQQEIIIQLLESYSKEFYKRLKNAYEGQYMEAVELDLSDENKDLFFEKYQVSFQANEEQDFVQEMLKEKLLLLRDFIQEQNTGKIAGWNLRALSANYLPSHLFYPLLSLDDKRNNLPVKISPKPLVESETKFIQGLEKAEQTGKLAELLNGRSLYLMRNAERKDKGVGFALAGNFYPDFLLWVVDHKNNKQWLSFIDPKGVKQMELDDPKFGLAEEIKKIQHQIDDENLILNSFILPITPFFDWNKGLSKDELAEKHILFLEDEDWVERLFGLMEQ